jgi:CrcB protein
MNRTFALFVVFVGGGIGSAARHLVNQVAAAFFGVNFGWGTLAVNILGSFLMGVLAGWFALKADGGELLRLFLTTGILGGFTTFSAFSLDAVLLWQRGQIASSIAYIGISVIVSLVSLFVGLSIVRA